MRRSYTVSVRVACSVTALVLASCEPAPPRSLRLTIAHNAKAGATSGLPTLLERTSATGRGVLIAEWDEGAVRASHADVIGRVARRDGAPLSQHATHIAGTLIGTGAIDPAARGMAPDAHLWSYRWDWDVLEEREAAPFIAASAHAYGIALGWAPAGEGCDGGATFFGGIHHEDPAFGAYGKSAAELDRMLYQTDSISVWAVGNERMDAGPSSDAPHFHYPDCATEHRDAHADEATLVYGTLGGAISAKNAIAVGAVADVEVADIAPELIVPLSFSSFGPTDDGRIKPDLAASGETLYSASADADDAYGVFGGTSSAAAVVAGGVALLVERYRANTFADPSAAEVKALLVHTAREAGPHPGPDYALGYGLFDVAAAADALSVPGQQQVGFLADGEVIELRTDPIAEGVAVRATLAWLDPAGAIEHSDAAALVNDLDVSLIAPDGESELYPWRLDRSEPAAPARRDAANEVDTAERVDVPASENRWDGRWTVRIKASRPLHRGRPQRFAIVSSVVLAAPASPVLSSPRRMLIQLAEDTTAEAQLAISDRNGNAIAWSIESDTSWLEVPEAEGDEAGAAMLRIDASELAFGQAHLAKLVLRAGDERREIGVVVERACGEACASPTAPCSSVSLGSALGDAIAHGHAEPAPAVQRASCGDSNGASTVFTWRAPYADTFEVALSDAAPEAIVYALDASCAGQELACASNDDGQRVQLKLDAGENVALVVDSPLDRSFGLAIHSARGVCYGQCGETPNQGGCYCDVACVERGDCCEGACAACGQCDPARCEPEGCVAGSRCVRGRCEPEPCLALPDGDACDDADACTEDDTCIGGACAGTPFDCDARDPQPDASVPPDAATPPFNEHDAGADAGEDAALSEAPAASAPGCGCRAAPVSHPMRVMAWLALTALALGQRTRRRRLP